MVSWAFSSSASPILPSSESFVCGINKLLNFFKVLFNTPGIFRLSMLFLRSPAIVFTICRTVSVTNPSVYSCGCSELTVSTRVWNINWNLCTSCSLISISPSISLILSSIFWFSNLIFFLSWFSESSYLNSNLVTPCQNTLSLRNKQPLVCQLLNMEPLVRHFPTPIHYKISDPSWPCY